MVKASDFFAGGSAAKSMGVKPNGVPLSQLGDGAYYQPWMSGLNQSAIGTNISHFTPVYFGDECKIRSFIIGIAANADRGIKYGLYKVGSEFFSRGDEIFYGTVADNTFAISQCEVILASTALIEPGWYLFGVSALGTSSNNAPTVTKAKLTSTNGLDAYVHQLFPNDASGAFYNEGSVTFGLTFSAQLDAVSLGASLDRDNTSYCYAFGMET